MIRPKFLSFLRRSFSRSHCGSDGKRQQRQHFTPVRFQLETLEDRVVLSPTTFTLPIENQTGLNPAQYSVYALGFSTASQMELQSNGTFAPFSGPAGTIPSYNISTMPNITLNTATSIQGAIVFFFVVPNNQSPPSLSYTNSGTQVVQPASYSPPYGIVEITEDGGGTLPHIDVSAVNGFSVPLTLTLDNDLGQVGQSVPNPAINRANILDAYTNFMNAQGSAGALYQALVFGSNGIVGQADAILSPGQYLGGNANPGSALNSVWDNALNSLFGTTTGGPNGSGGMTLSMIGDDGGYYVGTPENLTISSVTYRILHFVGYTDQAETNPNSNAFNIFSPLTPDPAGSYQTNESAGEMVFANDGVFADNSGNVLGTSTGPNPTGVAKGLERDIAAALNRGVALLGPTDGKNGDDSIYWGTETNWYPAGQTENLYALFLHTATINGTPIFTLPSGAVKDAQGTLMTQAYAFPYDESPGHTGPGQTPSGQPNVPSKFDPVPNGATMATITLGPWFSAPLPPTSAPTGTAAVLFLAEDRFALTVDGVTSRFSSDPLFTQAGDRLVSLFNDLLRLDNPALYSGLSGLQSAINADPYNGTLWGLLAQAIGLELAANLFSQQNQS